MGIKQYLVYEQDQVATPAAPDAGFSKLYFKNDNRVYKLDSVGNELLVDNATTKSELDSQITDDDVAYIGQANVFTEAQRITNPNNSISLRVDANSNDGLSGIVGLQEGTARAALFGRNNDSGNREVFTVNNLSTTDESTTIGAVNFSDGTSGGTEREGAAIAVRGPSGGASIFWESIPEKPQNTEQKTYSADGDFYFEYRNLNGNENISVSTAAELIDAIENRIAIYGKTTITLADGVYDLSGEGDVKLLGGDDFTHKSLQIEGLNGATSNVILQMGTNFFEVVGGVNLRNVTIESNGTGPYPLRCNAGSIFAFRNLKIIGDTVNHATTGLFGYGCTIFGEGLHIENFDVATRITQNSRIEVFQGDIGVKIDNTGLGVNSGTGLFIDDGSFGRFIGDGQEIAGFDEGVKVETESHMTIKDIDIVDNNTGIFATGKSVIFMGENSGNKPNLRNTECADIRGNSTLILDNVIITADGGVFHTLRAQDQSRLLVGNCDLIRNAAVDGRWFIYARAESRLNWDNNNTVAIGSGTGSNDDIARIDYNSTVFDKTNTLAEFELINDGKHYGVDWD